MLGLLLLLLLLLINNENWFFAFVFARKFITILVIFQRFFLFFFVFYENKSQIFWKYWPFKQIFKWSRFLPLQKFNSSWSIPKSNRYWTVGPISDFLKTFRCLKIDDWIWWCLSWSPFRLFQFNHQNRNRLQALFL